MKECAPEAEIDNLDELAEHAEDVRAYLVGLRGGAPFLSGADSRLLHTWLTEGVSPSIIMASMDRVAVRRRKRRTRGRMTLSACRSEIRKMLGARPRPAEEPSLGGLALLAEELAVLTIAPSLTQHRNTLSAELARIATCASDADLEDLARQAISACRRFHEAVWEALIDQHAALVQDAATELDALRGVLRGGAWAAAVEEVARDRVRARYPRVSAQAVWDALNSPIQ